MMRNKKLSILFFSVILVLFFSVSVGALISLGASKNIKFFVLVPPEQILKDVKKIAVLDFVDVGTKARSIDGEKAADFIIASLLEKERGIHNVKKNIIESFFGKGKPGKTYQHGFTTDFYTIAERSRINKVITELNFSHSGLVDRKQAAKLGKILGVDAIISGNTKLTAEKKQYCYTTKKGKKKYYFKNEAAATLSMRIVGVSTGKIIGQKVSTKMVSEMADSRPMDVVRDEAIKLAAEELVFYFAPYFKLEKIDLKSLKAKEYKSIGKRAVKFLKIDKFSEALAIYTSIVGEDPYNHRAIYMQGVIYELASHFDKALERYNLAYQIYDKSKDYRKAIVRTEGQKALWKQLNKIGIRMDEIDITIPKGPIPDGIKKKIILKKNSKIRIPVYAEPDKKSEVIMEVPGGVSLDVISNENDFYKVKLINGKIGFVHYKNVK